MGKEKMTLTELARKIGIARSEMSRLVWGKSKVGPRTAQKIAAYLKDPDWRRFVHMPGEQLRRELEGGPAEPTS